jgi:hypothetical protein
MSAGKYVRPKLEALEDRITPLADGSVRGVVTGVLTVTPPAAQVAPQTIDINQQVAQVNLPNGNVISGNGLKTADVQTPVVTWTRTGPA